MQRLASARTTIFSPRYSSIAAMVIVPCEHKPRLAIAKEILLARLYLETKRQIQAQSRFVFGMCHQIDARGGVVDVEDENHRRASNTLTPIVGIDRHVADIDTFVGSDTIACRADESVADMNKEERAGVYFTKRVFRSRQGTIEPGVARSAFQREKRVDILIGRLLEFQVRLSRSSSACAKHHSSFLPLPVTERTGVSVLTPPLRLAKVSRPVSSHLPSTARFAQLSQDSVQSPSE